MWCIRTCHKPGVVRQGIFLLESTFSADSLMVFVQPPPPMLSHASTSVRTLKILNTSSYATVWTQENTAHTSRSGQHSEALKVKLKKKNCAQGLYTKTFQNPQTFHNCKNPIWCPNMAWTNNMKVHKSSAHPVKGCNPYCIPWPTHSISQNWQEVLSLWFYTTIFFFNYCSVLGNAVSEW